MEKLREYLKSLTPSQQHVYAQRCNTTLGYLRKALSVKPQLDGCLCRLLDEHSGGVVPKQYLRPDIWPELLEKSALNTLPDLHSATEPRSGIEPRSGVDRRYEAE